MSDDVPPVDPDLEPLFRGERARSAAPAGSKERVLSRVLSALPSTDGGGGDDGAGDHGHGGDGAREAVRTVRLGAAGAKLVPIVAAFLIGGATGGAIVATSMPSRVAYVDRPATDSASPSRAPVASASSSVSIPTMTMPLGSSASSTPPSPVPGGTVSPDLALAREREILDVARTALGRGDGVHALDAVERHTREFPRGQMIEEREAIAVQALAKLGRADAAATRGERFRKLYPTSVLVPVIDAALSLVHDAGH